MSEFIMMVGLPGAGKTTYINELKKNYPHLFSGENAYVVISLDDIIMELGGGLSYDEAHFLYLNQANEVLAENLEDAFYNDRNIIVDMTNLSVQARKRLGLDKATEYNYNCIAIVFNILGTELKRRYDKRMSDVGKIIPQNKLDNMVARCVMPTEKEGFQKIIVITE